MGGGTRQPVTISQAAVPYRPRSTPPVKKQNKIIFEN